MNALFCPAGLCPISASPASLFISRLAQAAEGARCALPAAGCCSAPKQAASWPRGSCPGSWWAGASHVVGRGRGREALSSRAIAPAQASAAAPAQAPAPAPAPVIRQEQSTKAPRPCSSQRLRRRAGAANALASLAGPEGIFFFFHGSRAPANHLCTEGPEQLRALQAVASANDGALPSQAEHPRTR